jgi:hypothetical protein
MKYINRTWLFLFPLILSHTFWGCDTWETDINVNPNDPSGLLENEDVEYDPSEFMQDMIWSTVRGWDYVYWNVAAAVTAYHGKTISLSQGNRHQAWHAFDDSGPGPWGGGYGAVRYIRSMRKTAEIMNDDRYLALADIWECYNFFNMTLLYGDIPYSESIIDNAPINPVYDKQEDIYFTLISKLKAAGKSINPSSMANAQVDRIFSGDMMKWKKFANTLLIRYAMHMCHAAPDSTQALLNEIISDPGTYPIMTSNDDNAYFHYDGVEYQSTIYRLPTIKIGEAPFSNVFVERLVSLQDPRLPLYARPVQQVHTDADKNVLPSNSGVDKYAGHLYGISTDNAYASSWNGGVNYASRLGPFFRTQDATGKATPETASLPIALATYSEMLSFLAEAKEKEWFEGGQSARWYYEESIRASFDQYDASFSSDRYIRAFGDNALGSVEDYIKQPHVDWEGGRDKLLLIAEQKWIASFLLMFEPYFDIRRTMLPPLRASSGAANYDATGSGTRLPSRADYPADEFSTNRLNVEKANRESYDIVITGEGNRNLALMWLIRPKGADWLQMPIFQEPKWKEQYPALSKDQAYGSEFKSWYDAHWKSMFWWESNN